MLAKKSTSVWDHVLLPVMVAVSALPNRVPGLPASPFIMELRGQLKSWNDQKGFRFIRPEQGGEEIFAHISAMRGARRPAPGDPVLYVADRDKGGRLRAAHIRLDALSIDASAVSRKPSAGSKPRARREGRESPARRDGPLRQPQLKIFILVLLCLPPAFGTIGLAQQGMHWPLLAYVLASLLVFGLYWRDKRSAMRSGSRIPEARLHLIELLGGWPGALLAQQLFRHKTRKRSFQLVFWLIITAHQVVWLDHLYFQQMHGLLVQLPTGSG